MFGFLHESINEFSKIYNKLLMLFVNSAVTCVKIFLIKKIYIIFLLIYNILDHMIFK
jgi:hypothetical protein